MGTSGHMTRDTEQRGWTAIYQSHLLTGWGGGTGHHTELPGVVLGNRVNEQGRREADFAVSGGRGAPGSHVKM